MVASVEPIHELAAVLRLGPGPTTLPDAPPAKPDTEPDRPPPAPDRKPDLDPFNPEWPDGRPEPQPKAAAGAL